MNVVTTKSISLPIMEKEDIDKDAAKRYFEENKDNISLQVKTLSENGFEALAIGLMQHCLKVPSFSDDPSILPQLLILLNKTGKVQEFHDQCCELSCCKALKVVDWLRNQVKSTDKQVLQNACEIFFLQNLLSPKKLCCTEQLLRSWLSCFHEEDSVSSIAVDNINKMLGVVESTQHLSLFLKAIYDEFGIKLLPLCTDLALRIFKLESPTVTVGGNPKQANVTLAQTVEIVGKLFRNFIPLYSECLLSSLLLDPSLERLWSVNDFYSGNCPLITPCKMLPVDIKIYNCILHSISTFRPPTLARMLTWHDLKKLIIEQLNLQGFPIPKKFAEGEIGVEEKTENGDVSDKESDKIDDGHDLPFMMSEVNEGENIDKNRTNYELKNGFDCSSNSTKKNLKSKLNLKIDGPSLPMSQKRARKMSTKYAEEYETFNNKLERKANKSKVTIEQLTSQEIVSPPKKKKLECNGDAAIEETIRVTRSMKPKNEVDETELANKKMDKPQAKSHKKMIKSEEVKQDVHVVNTEPKKNLRQKKVTIGDDQIKDVKIINKCKENRKCKVIKPKGVRKLAKLNINDSKLVTPCVCDGCGEVVPDCSWLTAHIVTCSGRPQVDNTEDDLDMQQNENSNWPTENSSPKKKKVPTATLR